MAEETQNGLFCGMGADRRQGFGVTARSTAETRKLDPTAITVFRQADIGEYLREVGKPVFPDSCRWLTPSRKILCSRLRKVPLHTRNRSWVLEYRYLVYMGVPGVAFLFKQKVQYYISLVAHDSDRMLEVF